MSQHDPMLPSEETVALREFLAEMGVEVEQQYVESMESALDTCLECDLFSWHESEYGGAVDCRMRENPIRCGGPYHRVRKGAVL